MNKYFLEETEFTPELLFDINARKLSFKGVSRPEDVFKFYHPAIDWLKEFVQELTVHSNEKYDISSLQIDFHLSYFNSSSSKMLLQILEIIKKIQENGIEIKIDWFYDASDEQMYDDGMDLSESVDLPFNFKPI